MRPNSALIDVENPEWTQEEWSRAVRGSDFFTPEQLNAIKDEQSRLKLRLSQQEKISVKLDLDKDIVEKFKVKGKDWQQRINDVLRRELAA